MDKAENNNVLSPLNSIEESIDEWTERVYQRRKKWMETWKRDGVSCWWLHDCGMRISDRTLCDADKDWPVCPRCQPEYQWVWLLREELVRNA